jgi:hypothetical protein
MTLYHYTSGQGLYGILNSSQLHCSDVNFMNDPSERTYFLDLLEVVFIKAHDCKDIYSGLYNKSYQDAVTDPFDRYVASFSKNPDSLSMWNYYAKGNGYNLGLDIDKIIEANRDENFYIQKIELNYKREQQIDETVAFIRSQKENCNRYNEIGKIIKGGVSEDDYYDLGYEQHNLIGEFNEGIYKLALGFKHYAYEREEEVRLVISENEVEQKSTRFKTSENGVFVEYLPLKLDLKTNLKSVTVHPLNADLHLSGAKRFINSIFHNQKIDIKMSSIPFRLV